MEVARPELSHSREPRCRSPARSAPARPPLAVVPPGGSPPRRSLPVQPQRRPSHRPRNPTPAACTAALESPSRLAPVVAARVSELPALLSCRRHRAPGGSGESWGVRACEPRKDGFPFHPSPSPGLCRQPDDRQVPTPTSVMLGRGRSRGLGLGLLSRTAPSSPRFGSLTLAGSPS